MPPLPIVRAETYYLPPTPPRGQDPVDWSGYGGAELVYLWWEVRGRRIPIPTTFEPDAPPVYARIDDNRWLAECDACRSACVVSVLDPRFGCAQCRRAWVELIVPDDVEAIEAEVLPLARRFWWHPDDPRNPNRPEPEPEPPTEPEEPTP
ncbi:hypothetical protein ACFXKG_18570 [Streptomyces sp. NPDC059255]|uniref:hypothetical protein n=1 Tax=Streptomyces sp. NPDC059255 TaxID=3346793 RepID=UPI0036909D9E